MLIGIIIFMIVVSLYTEPVKLEKTLPSLGEINRKGANKMTYMLAGVLTTIMIGLYIIFG